MKHILVIILAVANLFANAQTALTNAAKNTCTLTEENFRLETDRIFDKLVKIRRKLHANPELAGKEVNTQNVVKQYLTELGLEVKTGIYGYGIVGILKGGKKGKSIAWRADMDALPNDFPDNVDFKSVSKAVQHGCGHDVHMTIALGIAEVLARNKNALQGTVYFIFQPQEETFRGAKGMVDNHLFATIKPMEIYGLHITPFPVGQVIVKANEMFAYQKGVRILFKNNVSNEKLAELTSTIRAALIRTTTNSKPWDLQRVLDPEEGLANPNTIFKDYFIMGDGFSNYCRNDTTVLEFDVYETNKERVKDIIPSIEKAIGSQDVAAQLISVAFFKENSTINNNPRLTHSAIAILDKMYGKGTVRLDYGQVPFSNDDFSYFQQKVPGVYFFLGGSNFAKGMIAMIHAPNFMVDEECIRSGVKFFSSLIYRRLSESKL